MGLSILNPYLLAPPWHGVRKGPQLDTQEPESVFLLTEGPGEFCIALLCVPLLTHHARLGHQQSLPALAS